MKRNEPTPNYNLDLEGLSKPILDSHAAFDEDTRTLYLGLTLEEFDPVLIRTVPRHSVVSSDKTLYAVDNQLGFLVTAGDQDEPKTAVRRCTYLDAGTLLGENRITATGINRLLNEDQAPKNLANRILTKLRSYNQIANEVDRLIAVNYVAYTYVAALFPIAPYLGLISWQPGSGKSRLLSSLERLCFNNVRTSGISTAALRRITETSPGTLMIDEFEAIGRARAADTELTQVLNAKFDVDARAYINTPVGKNNWVPIPYKLFSPLVYAKLAQGSVPDTVRDRSITIKLARLTEEDLNPEHPRTDRDWAWFRDDLYLWALRKAADIWDTFQNDPAVRHGLNRKGEIWRVMLSVAKHFLDEKDYAKLLDHSRQPEPLFEDDMTEEYAPIIEVLNEARSRGITRIKAKTLKDAISPKVVTYFVETDKKFVEALEYLAPSQDIEVRRWGPGRTAHVFFLGEGLPALPPQPKDKPAHEDGTDTAA